VDDVTAWCILAGVVAVVRSGHGRSFALGDAGGLGGVRGGDAGAGAPGAGALEGAFHRHGKLTQDLLGGILLLGLASAWVTEYLGIHALFGAFLAGAVMPKGERFVHALTEKLEDVTVVLLLPLFFAFTGLRTSFALLEGAEMWGFAVLIILVAVRGSGAAPRWPRASRG
jgi:Kef-type K+ transport system membrane component KefB